VSSSVAERSGIKGRAYEISSPDGATRSSLLLLQEGARVYGLYAQGRAAEFEKHRGTLDEIGGSLALERPALYPERRNDDFSFSVHVPPSWREARHFSGGRTLLLQFTSPPLAVDKGGQTVHASLTITVEPAEGDLEDYYAATRAKLGESFQVVSHKPWKDGYVDVMSTETSMADSRVKRFYRIGQGRGYGLTFEARADVYPRVARWYDLIADSFRIAGDGP
jgi:hypothetical protein